jgi:hypothetical protein
MAAPAVATLTVPHLTRAQLVDPCRNAPTYRVPIVNQIFVLGEPVNAARRRTVRAAMTYLTTHRDHLLSVARDDLAALDGWRLLVSEGRTEFDDRYRREFLTTEQFRRFDEALVRLLELLELPGVGRFASKALDVMRMPWTLTKKFFANVMARPDVSTMPERRVLEDALAGWIDLLRKEAARKAPKHSLWNHVHQGLQTGLADTIKERFNDSFRGFQVSLETEVERTARAIYEDLEKNPAALNAFRGTKFTMEVTAVTGSLTAIFWSAGLATPAVIAALVVAPLSASVVQMLVEFFGKQYVDFHREQTRERQQALVSQQLSQPLADWLTLWPTTGGSTYERLQQILQRFPENLKQLTAATNV